MEEKFNLKEEILNNYKREGGFNAFYSKYFDASELKNTNKNSAHCPFHKDNHPSLSLDLENGLFNCFGCGKKGDIFNFRMEMERIDFKEALRRFADELNILTKTEKKQQAFKQEDIEKFHAELFSEKNLVKKEYLNIQRGLNDVTLKKFKIGYSTEKSAYVIPYFDKENKIICTKLFKYNITTGEKEVFTYGKACLFGNIHLAQNKETIFLAEGEMDCMILNQNGFNSVSGSSGAATWRKEWTPEFKDKEVVICYDSDAPGRKGADTVIYSLVKFTKKIKNLDIFKQNSSKNMKDITDYFVKCSKNADDFLNMLNSTVYISSENYNDKNELLDKIRKGADKVQINAAQDFKDNILYYAIEIDNSKYILNSLKQFFEIRDGKAGELSLTTGETDLMRFSGDGIINFIDTNEIVNPVELFLKINNYIQRFIFLKDKNAYVLLSIWVMGTYIYRIFNYFPYIHLNAEKSSGKTLLMEVLAPICFNGQISVNSTEAVLFRDIQNNSLTLFLDEIETFCKEDKDKFAGIMSILKTGFNKSGLVKRCDGKNKDKVRSFSTYSPKMFAGINEIDNVLRDRIIKIRMYRKLENEICERYTLSKEITSLHKGLRDELYIFGLYFAAEIAEKYFNMEIEGIYHLNNRELDIWLPIFVIADIIDRYSPKKFFKIPSMITELSKKYLQEKVISDEMDNDTTKLLTVLNRMIIDLPPNKERDTCLFYSTDSVMEYFKKTEEYSWLESKTWLTRKLKNLDIKVELTRINDKVYRSYSIDKISFDDYLSRYTSINNGKNLEKTLENLFEIAPIEPL